MKHFPCLCLLPLLSACSLLGGLNDSEQEEVAEYRVRAKRYFNDKKYEKAIGQAESGLVIDPDNYELKGCQAWAYLQMSYRKSANTRRDLLTAEKIFAEIMGWRDDDEHNTRNILGYAIALNNRGRLEEDDGRRLRAEAKKPGAADATLIARGEEHLNRALAYDRQAQVYFHKLIDGNIAASALRRIAYNYLMTLSYRQKDFDKAIAYGTENLKLNASEVALWNKQYEETAFPERERQIRKDLDDLREDELKVRGYLAAYLREMKKHKRAIVHYNRILTVAPSRVEDYYRRGDCHRALGHREEARADFQRFLRLGTYAETHASVKDAHDYLYGSDK